MDILEVIYFYRISDFIWGFIDGNFCVLMLVSSLNIFIVSWYSI